MILYHGTIDLFDTVDVTKGKPFKDFGLGFYTSKFEKHAIGMAEIKRSAEVERIKGFNLSNPEPTKYLYTYQFDENNLATLNVAEFTQANREWARFITYNRKFETPTHNFDIVIGPTANDKTMPTVNAFFAGAYGNPDSNEAIDIFLKQILPEQLPPQFYFGRKKPVIYWCLLKGESLNDHNK